MSGYRFRNWSRFQHYRDRSPPWIKLHRTLLDDMDFARCPAASAKLLPLLLLLASERDGELPELDVLAFRLRVTEQAARTALSDLAPYLEHDDSGVLAPCLHDACLETEGETETEAETEGERASAPQPPPPPEGDAGKIEKPPKPPKPPKPRIAIPEWLTARPEWCQATWDAWMVTRTKKRAASTQHAVDLLCAKLAEHPERAMAAIQTCVEAGWTGFEWDWLDRRRGDGNGALQGQLREPRSLVGLGNGGLVDKPLGRPERGRGWADDD
jgi:hypothetical protein